MPGTRPGDMHAYVQDIKHTPKLQERCAMRSNFNLSSKRCSISHVFIMDSLQAMLCSMTEPK